MMNISRGINAQFNPISGIAMQETAARIRNEILCLFADVPIELFLNFIENIGTSLTSSRHRSADTAGMNQGVKANFSMMLSGSFMR